MRTQTQFGPRREPGNNWYHIGRLKPGATLQQAQAQVNALNNGNLERSPELKEILINAGFNTKVTPLQDMLTGGVKRTLYLSNP
jgi:hypothetical protein